MKQCPECGHHKPLEAYSRKADTPDGLQSRCKECCAAYLKRHRAAHPERWREWNREYKRQNAERLTALARARYAADRKASARKALALRVRRLYGLSIEEYDALVARPCAICGSTAGSVLDHDHETGVVRGPLCQMCNTGIGKLGDDPDRLRAAADYLEKHRT